MRAILEGGARVLGERGYAGATTNHVARAAGVSIGSLYEYFPNKEAIWVALAERHVEDMIGEIESLLESAQSSEESLAGLLRRFATAMLEVHTRNPELHGLLVGEAPHPEELHACVLRMEETLAHLVERLLQRSEEVCLADCDTAAHLVVQTTEALTHRFVHHGIHELGSDDFLDQVVALLRGYLTQAVELKG